MFEPGDRVRVLASCLPCNRETIGRVGTVKYKTWDVLKDLERWMYTVELDETPMYMRAYLPARTSTFQESSLALEPTVRTGSDNQKIYEESDRVKVKSHLYIPEAGRVGTVVAGRLGQIRVSLDPVPGEGRLRTLWIVPWHLEPAEGADQLRTFRVKGVRDDGVIGTVHISMPDSSFVPRVPGSAVPMQTDREGKVYQNDEPGPVPESVYVEIARLVRAGLDAWPVWHAAKSTWYAKIEE